MTKKRLKQILNQVPPDYYESGVKNNFLQEYWHKRKWHHLKEFFTGIKGKSLLDIGCADGTTTRQIQKILPDARIIGIDYYKHAVDYARKRKSEIKFVHGDVHNLPFGENSFDIVTAIETLEHLENPKDCLKNINRILKKDGQFIMTTPNWPDKIYRIYNKTLASNHKQAHSSLGWSKLVKSAGFKIISVRTVRFPVINSEFLNKNFSKI